MGQSLSLISAPKIVAEKALRIPREKARVWGALAVIVVVAAWLRFANLEALGYANHYYTAAVTAMLKSWHNFFFVAAEPGGSVTVDKPPVGLWLQTISAYFLGVNGFAVLLPQILAGILSVILVYHWVRRSFGAVAGLLAALVLAVTPVVVATDRNNTIDSTLILTLLLATGAFIKATESGRLRYLLLGAALVGIGFNIKMLQAYLPLPAFYALYFLGSSERLGLKIRNLVLASVLLVGISLSWAVIVDLTPADQRPYVGSSGNNSELSLILGYNGVDRLLGRFGGRGNSSAGNPPGTPPLDSAGPQGNPGNDAGGFPQGGAGGNRPQPPRDGNLPRPGDGGARRGGFPEAGGRGGGPGNTGQAGPLRLFIPPLSKEVGWLLPFGLISALLLAFSARPHWPLTQPHQAVVLWGGWLVTGGIFFSIAGFFHEYYLSMLAAPLAALVGIGTIHLVRWFEQRPWTALVLLLAAAGITLGVQINTARSFAGNFGGWPLILGLGAAGAGLLAFSAWRRSNRFVAPGFAAVMAALLITPAVWSGLTTFNSSQNQSLPGAYSGQSGGPSNRGNLQVDSALLDYLQSHTRDTPYLMAVPSSMQGADYVLATGRPVLYMGGFMGQDAVVTPEQLEQLVRRGDLRYIYWDARGGLGNQNAVSTWITARCTPVPGFETATRNTGAPDGTAVRADLPTQGRNGRASQNPGALQVSLYECGS